MIADNSLPLIKSISVRDMFGKLSYDIETPIVDGKLSRLLLIHGDNGSGKTTLLRLLWHTLSAADNQGHKTYLSQTAFSEFVVVMSDESSVTVSKLNGLFGTFTIHLRRPSWPDSVAVFEADELLRVRSNSRELERLLAEEYMRRPRRNQLSLPFRVRHASPLESAEESARAKREYAEYLTREVKPPLYLADDRSLYSDDPDIDRIRGLLSRQGSLDMDRRDRLSRLVVLELQVTMRRVNDYLRSLTLGGQNTGSANSNAIYINVLRRMVESEQEGDSRADSMASVLEELGDIASIAPTYEIYELVPKLDIDELRSLVSQVESLGLTDLVNRVISPFLSSLRAQYAALKDARDLLHTLVEGVNGFLRGKKLHFTPQSGLKIATSDGELLDIEALSSGERQLLTLLCTAVLTRVDSRLLVIDEPELSLGVDWQRSILDTLIDLTAATGVQFCIATHSIEIITSRPESLVRLRPL